MPGSSLTYADLAEAHGGTSSAPPAAAPPPVAVPPEISTPPPDFDGRVAELQRRMSALGYPVHVVSKRRSADQQKRLYAQGRSSPGRVVTEKSGAPGDESRHQAGLAADFAFVTPGGLDQSEKNPWDVLGRTAKEVGLEWGGDWTSLKDRPHVQLSARDTPVGKGAQVDRQATSNVKVTNAASAPAPAPVAGGPAATPPTQPARPAPVQVDRQFTSGVRVTNPVAPTVAATLPPGPVGPNTAADPFHEAHAAVRSAPYARAAAAAATPPPAPAAPAAIDYAALAQQHGAVSSTSPTVAAAPPPSGATTRSRTGSLYDPSKGGISPETQRLIGGAAGATAAGILMPEITGPALVVRGVQALTPVVGAAFGGGATAAAQGTPVGEGAVEQGSQEALGQAVSWPLKAVGRRLLAHPVAKAAAEHLGAARSMVNQQLDEILSKAEGAVRGTREGVAGAVNRAREAVRGAKTGVEVAEGQAAKDTAAAAGKWPGAKRAAAPGEPALAVSHAPAAATPPPPSGPVPPTVFDPSMVPVGEEAAHNAVRTAGQPAAAPPPAASAREQVLRDTRNPDVVDAAKAAQQRAATAPPAVVHPGPEAYAQTGRDVAATIQGPAKHSLDQLGEAVTEAAKTGPPVDMRPIKAKLESMAAETRPSTMTGEAKVGGKTVHNLPDEPTARAKILDSLKRSGVSVEDAHPLPGTLAQIQTAPDTVSFEDAHKLKRQLDEATNWSSPAKKQLQGITKGIRGELRDALAVHAPYNQATGAYQAAVPLFTKGVAKQITRSVEESPEGIVKLIKGDQPTKLQMLKDVLVHHASAGGGAEQGQAAWNGVRSAWTYEHLIKGGVEKFEGNLAKVHPDFLQTMYGDPEGQQVLGNLQQISRTFRQAQAGGEAAVGAAKAGVTAASDAAARTTEQGRVAVAQKATVAGATRAQVAEAKKPTAVETAFQQSSLASAPPPSQVAGDVLHTVASHGGNVFRARSVGRLVLGGPKVNDLVQWAAYSGARTQLLVKAVTSPAPGMMLADLYRAAGIAGEDREPPLAVNHAPSQPTTAAPPR